MIWHKEYKLTDFESFTEGTITQQLGIELTEIGNNFLAGKMPVDHRTYRPGGILHGGASVVLAETLGSLAGYMCVDPEEFDTVGLEINANHIRMAKQGYVNGKASAVHVGRKTQVWHIEIKDEQHKLICISRLTIAVVPAFHQKRPQ